jgi:integrase
LYGQGGIKRRKDGTLTIRYSVNGKEVVESVAKLVGKPPRLCTDEDARRALRMRLKQRYAGTYVGPQNERITLEECAAMYLKDLEMRRKRNRGGARSHLRRAVRGLGAATRIGTLTADAVATWVHQELESGMAPGGIHTTLGFLKAALRLAKRKRQLADVPLFPTLEFDNARQGFVERDQYLAIMAGLDVDDQDITLFGYNLGRRVGEILKFEWSALDRVNHMLRVRAANAKKREADSIPLVGEVWEMIERRWKARPLGSKHIFHREGRPIPYDTFYKHWKLATASAGCPDVFFHDLRRTAYRDMIEAGVDPFTAMDITGHKTLSMAKRYAIRNTRHMAKAMATLQAARDAMPSGIVVSLAAAKTRTKPGRNTPELDENLAKSNVSVVSTL